MIHRFRLALALATALLAGCSDERPTAPASVTLAGSDHRHFAGIPGVHFSFYNVEGRTAVEIRQAVEAKRPRDSNDGQRVDALTVWTINWRIPIDARGGCRLDAIDLTYEAKVILPRLVGRERHDPMLLNHWDAFVDALEKHESWHARYAYDHIADVRAAVRKGGCATAQRSAAAAVESIAAAQRDYDRATNHGADQGISFP